MEIDNEKDRFKYGFDAGQIIEGRIQKDESTGKYLIVDDDGVGFDVLAALDQVDGKNIRLTLVTMDALLAMEKMLK